MDLPTFRYHPDPLKTGSIKTSDNVCKSCGQARGYIYTGPIYSEVDDLDDAICPWCIADGTAHDKFDAEFTDAAMIGGGDLWDDVPASVMEEVAYRTPGFVGWQQEMWFTHHRDAAAFLGAVGRRELEVFGPDATNAIKEGTGLDGEEWQEYFEGLEKDGSPTAYLFQCLHCGAYGGYSDMD